MKFYCCSTNIRSLEVLVAQHEISMGKFPKEGLGLQKIKPEQGGTVHAGTSEQGKKQAGFFSKKSLLLTNMKHRFLAVNSFLRLLQSTNDWQG